MAALWRDRDPARSWKAAGMVEARVVSLHRYPVKSLLGEDLDAVELDERGAVGDRMWSVRTPDGKIGSGKTTRRFHAVPGLLQLRASYDKGRVRVVLPDGEPVPVDGEQAAARFSAYLSQLVTLARETDVSHFDDGPVSLLALASVDAVAAEAGHDIDPSRFRANVVLDGLPAFGEDALVGRQVRIGTALLEVTMRSPRCVMVDLETADLPRQHGNLLATGRANDACIGVIARVVEPGRIGVGAEVRV